MDEMLDAGNGNFPEPTETYSDLDALLQAHEAEPWIESELANRFTYHSPKPGQPERYTAIRDAAHYVGVVIAHLTPTSREQNLALTKLEEAVMFANAAIARREDTHGGE